MAAPGHETIVYLKGDDGAPANNDDPACGTITATVLADLDLNEIINFPPADVTDESYYGGFYIKNTSTGNLINARVFSRTACFVNPIAGQISIGVDRADDAGKKVFIWGKVGGLVDYEYLELPASGVVTSAKSYDAETVKFYETVNASNLHVFPVGVLTISQSGVVLGVIRGTGANPSGIDLSVCQLNTFVQLALLDTKGGTLTFTDRKTGTPSVGTLSAFSIANRWTGVDNALAVPGNELNADEEIAVGVLCEMPADFPSTHYGSIILAPNIIGSAVA